LASYLVPLLGLLIGAMAGQALDSGQTEAFTILGGLFGLVAGLGWLYSFARRNRGAAAYQAIVLRRLPDYSAAFVRFPQ
jgi:sigma-E factor negative regulatory protein RseC